MRIDSVIGGLSRLKIDSALRRILQKSTQTRKSRILTSVGPTEYFNPQKGIEQGDPLSPIIWNIFYDEVLTSLNEISGYNFEGYNVSYMAYADDLVIISESQETAILMLQIVNDFLISHKLEIQPKKTIQISNFTTDSLSVKLLNNEIQELTVLDRHADFTYLGATFNLKIKNNCLNNITENLKGITSKLKAKKISMCNAAYIFNCVIAPKLCYQLSGSNIQDNKTEEVEKCIRQYVKWLLKLPISFSTKCLHLSEYLFRIQNIADILCEQEISTLFIHLHKRNLPGILLENYLKALEKCHPIFTSPRYET